MQGFFISNQILKRYLKFSESSELKNIPDYSLTEYWREHSGNIKVKIVGDKVLFSGTSGFKVTPIKPLTVAIKKAIELLRKLIWLIPGVKKILIYLLKTDIESFLEVNLEVGRAFDAVMNQHPPFIVGKSPYLINFLELKKKKGVISSIKEIEEVCPARKHSSLNDGIVLAYYYNIICGYTDTKKVKTVLEIGAGNGNMASIMYYHSKKKVIIVDLPEMLSISIIFLSNLFPSAKMLLPHEATKTFRVDADFIFLTPQQIDLVPDDSVDLSINTASFQEMSHKQIDIYFRLIQRATANRGYFFTANRVEKTPGDFAFTTKGSMEPPNRFSEYPWDVKNKVLVYEICHLNRLLQRNNVYLRLEQVIK